MKRTDLIKLKTNLPRNYGKILAKETGKSTSAIYQVLAGKINSPYILEAAIVLAKKTKEKNNSLTNDIKSL